MWFFLSLCVTTLSLALILAVQGYWPVLPFAGLELSVLGWALYSSMQRRHHRQVLLISDEEVKISSKDLKNLREVVFPRHWAQVKMRRSKSALLPSLLTIESHGRYCEVGSFLTEQERLGLGKRLKQLIGRVNESPVLLAHD
jgi:uncharacterized membrane protein